MLKKPTLFLIILIVLSYSTVTFAKISVPGHKQTVLGLYILAKDAYSKWLADTANVKILDIRTQAEYIFVGHPQMATNIPFTFLQTAVNLEPVRASMHINKKFIDDVKKVYKKTDLIMVICRSGNRSAAAVNVLAKAGFKNLYSVIDGFEGGGSKTKGINYGKRVVNGWKNSGIPWTYRLDPRLIYTP
jgi:rhodanese-related sulfurtransferase